MIEMISVIGSFVFVICLVGIISGLIRDHMKMKAALRIEEMERGYVPGTYSRHVSKGRYKKMMREAERGRGPFSYTTSDKAEREDLEKGIRDLEERMKNLDEIMKERARANG